MKTFSLRARAQRAEITRLRAENRELIEAARQANSVLSRVISRITRPEMNNAHQPMPSQP